MKRLSLIDKSFLLKKTPLFQAIDLDLLLPIADKLGTVHFDAGETLFELNDEAHKMYLIVRGTIEMHNADGKILAVLTSEEFFGDESLFNDKPRAYKAVCRTDATLLTLSQTNLLTIISESPSVAVGFLQVYATSMEIRPRKFMEREP